MQQINQQLLDQIKNESYPARYQLLKSYIKNIESQIEVINNFSDNRTYIKVFELLNNNEYSSESIGKIAFGIQN